MADAELLALEEPLALLELLEPSELSELLELDEVEPACAPAVSATVSSAKGTPSHFFSITSTVPLVMLTIFE